jgi:hypothetical protein
MNFIDSVIAGKARIEEIDDWIDRWHDDPVTEETLHEFLGMTWGEFKAWVEHGLNLEEIVDVHRKESP